MSLCSYSPCPAGRRRPRRVRLGVALACAAAIVVLGGCVTTRLPDLRVQDLPEHWRVAPEDARPSQAHDAGPWWHAFHDPALDRLIDQALAADLDVTEARARLRAARILQPSADASLRPNLRLATSDPIDPDASASFLVAGFDSVWELDLFGRGTALRRLARAEVETAEAGVSEARVTVAAEVARQWIELRAAQRREALLVRIRDARAVQSDRTETRVRLALASPAQAAQAHAALGEAEAALAEPRIVAAAAGQALAVLLGRNDPDPAWQQAGDPPALGAWAMPPVPADLLRMRPDVARDQAAVLRAAGELGIAKADRFPRIAIGGSIQWSTSEVENRSTSTSRIGAFGPIIDMPLFDWGMRKAQADAKGELLQAAALHYKQTVLAAVSEVQTTLASLEQQRLREEASSGAWRALDAAARRAARRKDLGLASGLDVAASDIERDEAELRLLDARTERAIGYVALGKALGAVRGVTAADDAECARNPADGSGLPRSPR